MSAIVGGAALGGVLGGGLAITVLAPLTAANNFIGSFFFGDGMIIGERKAYQNDWPKIKARLDKGESFLNILEGYTIENTTAVMQSAKMIIEEVKPIWFEMVRNYLTSIPQDLLQAVTSTFSLPPGGSPVKAAANKTIEGLTSGLIQEAFAEESTTGHIDDRPSYFNSLTLGQLQTRYLREKDPAFKLVIYREVQLRLQQNPKILKPDPKPTVKDINEKIKQNLNKMKPSPVVSIALQYQKIQFMIQSKETKSAILREIKIYNRLVQLNRKPNLTFDTAYYWSTGKLRLKK